MILDRHNRVNAAELYARLHSNEAMNEAISEQGVDNNANTNEHAHAQHNCPHCGKSNFPTLPEDQIDEFVNMMQVLSLIHI